MWGGVVVRGRGNIIFIWGGVMIVIKLILFGGIWGKIFLIKVVGRGVLRGGGIIIVNRILGILCRGWWCVVIFLVFSMLFCRCIIGWY